jgi:hypothetical protein
MSSGRLESRGSLMGAFRSPPASLMNGGDERSDMRQHERLLLLLLTPCQKTSKGILIMNLFYIYLFVIFSISCVIESYARSQK